MRVKQGTVTGRADTRSGDSFFLTPGAERQILLLRWLALLLVVVLDFFDRTTAGVIVPVPQMALGVVGYNLLLLVLMRYLRWLRQPLNFLAVDTVVATLAVFLTGGYHSSFFVLYVGIIIAGAFYMELVPTIVVALGLGLIYAGACYMSPAGLDSPYALYIMAAKLLLLLIVAVLCALLLEQLRREHRETECERALALRLTALNDLFHQLNTTLDLNHTLQMVADAPRTLLDADLTDIALLEEDGRHLTMAAAAGVDVALFTGQRWPVNDEIISAVLDQDRPTVVDEPSQYGIALTGQPDIPSVESVVSVPLLLESRPLGVLDVAYRAPTRFTEEELNFLHALGQEAALAIRNARLYEREREQVARLRALDEMQQGFVSSVSHELRTPLTCIKTSVDLLRETRAGLSGTQTELVRTIDHHVGRLEGLVSDLLQITQLEAGTVTLSRQPSDLRSLVLRVVGALSPLTQRKDQTVHVDHSEVSSLVDVDHRRIEQVLTNIVSNASKFTPKGGLIEVHLTEAAGEVRVCVSDNGPGIPPQERERVFDRFYTVADGRGLSGIGLGLYIAQQLVQLHGGRIWVESQVGEGSTFCFALPATPSEDEP